jgi:ABC-type branched-subunit amino acid transport system substrate-binding protein
VDNSTSRKATGMTRGTRGRRAGLAAGATLALTLTACGGSVGGDTGGGNGGGAADPLSIGLMAPITGPVASEGEAMKMGFDLALKEINADGGVLGQDIEVDFLDDKADPAIAAQSANRLITENQVDYLFGTITGDTSLAVGKVATEAEVPFSTAEMGTAGICTPYVWAFGETDPMILTELVPHMLETKGTRVALVGSDYSFPRSFNGLARELIEGAGGEVVAEEYAPLGTADWQPVIGKLSSAAPDWTLSAVVGGDAVSFVRQADEFGLLATSDITGISLIQDYYPAMGGVTDGRELVTRYSDALPGEANEKFVAAFREAYDWDAPIPGVAANAYEGLKFIAAAVEAAGTTETAAVMDALSTTTTDGIFGETSFTENHRFQTDMQLVRVEAGGKYVPVENLGVVEDPTECR